MALPSLTYNIENNAVGVNGENARNGTIKFSCASQAYPNNLGISYSNYLADTSTWNSYWSYYGGVICTKNFTYSDTSVSSGEDLHISYSYQQIVIDTDADRYSKGFNNEQEARQEYENNYTSKDGKIYVYESLEYVGLVWVIYGHPLKRNIVTQQTYTFPETTAYITSDNKTNHILTASISISPSSIQIGGTATLSASALLDGENYQNFSISGGNVHTSKQSTTITGISLGTDTYTNTATYLEVPATASCSVNVIDNTPQTESTISLDKTALTLQNGSSDSITATTTNYSGTISWQSSDSNLATLSSNTGSTITVTAKSNSGTVTITATLSDNKSASCTITLTGQEEVTLFNWDTNFYNPMNTYYNQPAPVTASEWNRLVALVNQYYGTNYSSVTSGTRMVASSGGNIRVIADTLGVTVRSGNQVTRQFFFDLRDAINNKIQNG